MEPGLMLRRSEPGRQRFLPGLCLIATALFPLTLHAAESSPFAACALNKAISGKLSLKGKTWTYERRLATLTLHDAKGNPTACLSYVSYTADRSPSRPVTFFFNGGPGSSGLFLQLGSFGPLRVPAEASRLAEDAHYNAATNPMTLLDASDLVFVDPVGTGFSHPLREKKNADFWGVDQDAAASADFVAAYLDSARRWNVPLYLFGESYGTTRISVTSRVLAERGIFLNGLIFMSTVLNYGERLPGMDMTTLGYLPTYAAIAWFHRKSGYQNLNLNTLISQAESFAATAYMQALWQGKNLDLTTEQAVTGELARYTGLSIETIRAHALRPDVNTFRSELLKSDALITGRYDARATAPMSYLAPDTPDFDPSNENVRTPLTTVWNKQLGQDFGYDGERPYVIYDNTTSSAWDWRHKAKGRSRLLETAVTGGDLAETMARNPGMRVIFLNGLYDLATPFSLTAYDIRHLNLPISQIQNTSFCRYPAGHMMYFDNNALEIISQDLHKFYDNKTPCYYK